MKCSDEASMLIVGDYYIDPQSAKRGTILFGDLLSYIQTSDISIVNLEAPIAEQANPIEKTGPVISLSAAALEPLKDAGFNVLTLGNNHIMDYGPLGLHNTIQQSAKKQLNTVGAGRSIGDAKTAHSSEINGVKIAVLNFAENEFSTTHDTNPGANPLDPISNYRDIASARATHDHVIVIVHGGHEGFSLPSPRMQETYRFFIDAGASSVIGHHTHCVSGYEMYRDCPIFYSLGNFLFEWPTQKTSEWYVGLAIRLTLKKVSLTFDLIPFKVDQVSGNLEVLKGDEHMAFLKKLEALNLIIADKESLSREFNSFVKKMTKMYSAFIEPHSNRWIYAFQSRKFLGSFLSRRKRKLLLNIIRCEAHRDIILKILANENRNS